MIMQLRYALSRVKCRMCVVVNQMLQPQLCRAKPNKNNFLLYKYADIAFWFYRAELTNAHAEP